MALALAAAQRPSTGFPSTSSKRTMCWPAFCPRTEPGWASVRRMPRCLPSYCLVGAVSGDRRASLPVAEAVEETAEDAAFAGEGRAGRRRGRVLPGDGLVVVGAGDGVDDLGFAEVLGALDLGHVADKHAIAHDLGLQAGCAVGIPLSFAAAGQ